MTNLPALSVIVCSHNPRRDFLSRVLSALREQSLPQERWELVLIDNGSSETLSDWVDLSWHSNGRHIREDQLGLTYARLTGISCAAASILVFVDDDNVLSDTYLENALSIGMQYPFLGAWGGGILAEFETPPPEWTRTYWPNLAIRDVKNVQWTNVVDHWSVQPCGAGLCVRKEVANAYSDALKTDHLRIRLDRKGSQLTSGGDTDLVLTSKSLNLGWGLFPTLNLTHLIPNSRVTEQYLLRLTEGISSSCVFLTLCHGHTVPEPNRWRTAFRALKLSLTKGTRTARFYVAGQRGCKNGHELYKSRSRR